MVVGKPTPMTKHHEWTESQPMSPFKTETTRKTTMMTRLMTTMMTMMMTTMMTMMKCATRA